MTKEDIIDLTRQAGGFDATPEFLERFALLVVAHQQKEQEKQWPLVQVSPLDFVEMVYGKENITGNPIVWAQWPTQVLA